MNKKELSKIYKDYNLTKDDIYQDRRGFVILCRSGCEKIQLSRSIQVEYEVICCSLENVVIKATSYLKNQDDEWLKQIETFGSASVNNCKQHFLVEIAEKRAKARVIIMTLGLVNTYGDDELKHQP
tara:strand:+ start:1330 stop:1707 length:378 start_codon:yes stop_codon:yes gene_type:complete